MSNLKDFKNKNTAFTGTLGIDLPVGTTGERATGYGSGTLRFNSTTGLMEYYTGSEWKAVDSPPAITGFTISDVGGSAVTSGTISTAAGTVTIEVLGSLFDTTGAVVSFVPDSGSTVNTASITRNSSNKLTVTVAAGNFANANEPYDIRVANGSGLSANLEDALQVDTPVAFTNAANTTVSIFDTARSGISIAAADLCGATDADGDTITYSISTGSLPSGLSINSGTGVVSGSVSAVGSDTTTTFTISAATTAHTATRQFKITVKAPTVSSFNSPGTFAVPTGVTSVNVLVVAGGGGAGGFGGGGAGGLVYRPGFSVTPGATIPVSIGSGGAGGQGGGQPTSSQPGQDTTFSTLTAKGGGGGGQSPLGGPGNQNVGNGAPGGSGGGGGHPNMSSQGGSQGDPGIANQPTQSGESGQYGFGANGGQGRNNIPSITGEPGSTAGGGGGAGGSGGPGQAQNPNNGGPGGVGRAYSISGSSVYYSGGGGGAYGGLAGQGGGGNAENPNTSAGDGTANRGGGGGMRAGPGQPGTGGSGVVIVTF
tara:strand:+ start:543 stop:2159 length:1617 start_codon:yes stop_codon:yes gene_type:complete